MNVTVIAQTSPPAVVLVLDRPPWRISLAPERAADLCGEIATAVERVVYAPDVRIELADLGDEGVAPDQVVS